MIGVSEEEERSGIAVVCHVSDRPDLGSPSTMEHAENLAHTCRCANGRFATETRVVRMFRSQRLFSPLLKTLNTVEQEHDRTAARHVIYLKT